MTKPAHEWVKGGTAFFGAMGGFLHFKLCSQCGVRVEVTSDEYEQLPTDERTHHAPARRP